FLHLLLRETNHFLNAGRMNATILNQLAERHPRHLASHVIETADNDNPRRIVDDDVHACSLLERPNVPTFSADDPTLHLVIRDVDGRSGRFGCMGAGIALDSRGEYLTRLLFTDILQARFMLLQPLANLLG